MLLAFIDSNEYYSVSRLFSLVSTTGGHALHRIARTILITFRRLARAILLGRLGRHDQTLELYVYHLHKAEEYVHSKDYPQYPC